MFHFHYFNFVHVGFFQIEFVGTVTNKKISGSVVLFTLRDESGVMKVKLIDSKATRFEGISFGSLVRVVCLSKRIDDDLTALGLKIFPLVHDQEAKVIFHFLYWKKKIFWFTFLF